MRQRIAIPLATNMCVIDLDSTAEGLRLGSVDAAQPALPHALDTHLLRCRGTSSTPVKSMW